MIALALSMMLACQVAAEAPSDPVVVDLAPGTASAPAVPVPAAQQCSLWSPYALGAPLPPADACLDLGADTGTVWTADDIEVLLHKSGLQDLGGLRLAGQPVGMAGAKAIAASRALAHLHTLDLTQTGLGENGARALCFSKYLDKLIVLRVDESDVGMQGLARLRERFGTRVEVVE